MCYTCKDFKAKFLHYSFWYHPPIVNYINTITFVKINILKNQTILKNPRSMISHVTCLAVCRQSAMTFSSFIIQHWTKHFSLLVWCWVKWYTKIKLLNDRLIIINSVLRKTAAYSLCAKVIRSKCYYIEGNLKGSVNQWLSS